MIKIEGLWSGYKTKQDLIQELQNVIEGLYENKSCIQSLFWDEDICIIDTREDVFYDVDSSYADEEDMDDNHPPYPYDDEDDEDYYGEMEDDYESEDLDSGDSPEYWGSRD